jgi:hypothetical protein
MTGDLGARQRALVAALVAGGPIPAGFDEHLVEVAREALRRKRAGEVAHHWPLLVAGFGDGWMPAFARWASGRAPLGGLRDGWDLARSLRADGRLAGSAAEELVAREVSWRYDGESPPRRRRLPAARRAGGGVVVQVAGRVRVFRLPGGASA